jgi:hypothetical protein
MGTDIVIRALDEALPDSVVEEALRSILRQEAAGAETVCLEMDGEHIMVPRDASTDLVTKAFFKEYYDVGFSTGYRAQVAIGGVISEEHGIAKAKHCFATLYFDRSCQLITIDFHAQMR